MKALLLAALLTPPYPWLAAAPAPARTVAGRFAPPAGARRVTLAPGSWGAWLRGLPLKPAGTPARLYDGKRLKNRQDVVAAVVDIDAGPADQDLQQCADAVMRLRAEYLLGTDHRKLHFHLSSGYDARFADYLAGRAFRILGPRAAPAPKPAEAPTHAALRRWLRPVMDYANSASLAAYDTRPVPLAQVQVGDLWLRGGAPGHAVLVVDLAHDPRTGRRYLLLAQSYMPAQDIHVLRNVRQPALGAWFEVPGAGEAEFDAGEYVFKTSELARLE